MGGVIKSINNHIAGWIGWIADLFYRAPLNRYFSRELLRYAVCGVGNYIIFDAVLYFLIYHYLVGQNSYLPLGFVVVSPHVLSLIIVFPITFLMGFWLNRYVAFSSTESDAKPQLMRYAISIIGSIAISYISLKLLVEHLHLWATPAKVVTSAITSCYSYLMARYFTFRK